MAFFTVSKIYDNIKRQKSDETGNPTVHAEKVLLSLFPTGESFIRVSTVLTKDQAFLLRILRMFFKQSVDGWMYVMTEADKCCEDAAKLRFTLLAESFCFVIESW